MDNTNVLFEIKLKIYVPSSNEIAYKIILMKYKYLI